MFTAEQRRKEIGLRKVVGASVANIVTMLSTDIMRLMALAAAIATPLAWLAMKNWLQNFAYHINLTVWIFLLEG